MLMDLQYTLRPTRGQRIVLFMFRDLGTFSTIHKQIHMHTFRLPRLAFCCWCSIFELTNSIYADNYSCLYSPPLGPQRPHESIEPHHLTEEQLEQHVHHKTCGCISRLGLTMNLLCVCIYIYMCKCVCVFMYLYVGACICASS